jgi:predicted MFS family arabinose efflux permease
LVALFIVLGLARGILRVTSAATVAELRSEGRDVGLASGVYSAGLDFGAIAGPALGGVLGNALGLAGMFQVVGAASVAMYFAVALASPAGRSALRAGLRAAAPRPAAAGDIGRPDPAQGP